MCEMSCCVCVCKPQNLGIHQAGPRYCWYSPCRSDLRICDFRVFFRSLFRASKMRRRTVTQPFVTVHRRTFWGRQADPVLKSGFFYGLEIQRFFLPPHPRESSQPPPASPAPFALSRPPARLCIACFKLRTCIGSCIACFALRTCIGSCIACFEL
jgi:hypothetical protein